MSEKVEEILTDSVAEPKKRRCRKSKTVSEKAVAVATMSMLDTESVDIKKETASETNEVSVEAETVEADTVEVSDDTTSNEPMEEAVPHTYITGECIEAPLGFRLYTSSVSKTARGRIRGKFYVWDPTVCEGRIRITDSPSGVARIDRCIGWANVCELELFVK